MISKLPLVSILATIAAASAGDWKSSGKSGKSDGKGGWPTDSKDDGGWKPPKDDGDSSWGGKAGASKSSKSTGDWSKPSTGWKPSTHAPTVSNAPSAEKKEWSAWKSGSKSSKSSGWKSGSKSSKSGGWKSSGDDSWGKPKRVFDDCVFVNPALRQLDLLNSTDIDFQTTMMVGDWFFVGDLTETEILGHTTAVNAAFSNAVKSWVDTDGKLFRSSY